MCERNCKIGTFDDRSESKSKGEIQEITMSKDNYSLVTIPKNIWNGFMGIGEDESIVANCLTLPHNEMEMVRVDPFSDKINYDWK